MTVANVPAGEPLKLKRSNEVLSGNRAANDSSSPPP